MNKTKQNKTKQNKTKNETSHQELDVYTTQKNKHS